MRSSTDQTLQPRQWPTSRNTLRPPAFVGSLLTDAEVKALDASFFNNQLRPAELPKNLTKVLP